MNVRPPMSTRLTFIIDFDSTFIQGETLDELAKIALKDHPERDAMAAAIADITRQGMEGALSFTDSLIQRLRLIRANQEHLQRLIQQFKKSVTPSFRRNKAFFKKYARDIYIISGGFRSIIEPVVTSYGILPEHIFANEFMLDSAGIIIGFDPANVLAQADGKVLQLRALKLSGVITAIGDGITDYRMKEAGAAHRFIAFTENVRRESVVQKADLVADSFDEFLYTHRLPMATSYPKSRLKALLLENIHPVAVRLLKEEGYKVELLTKSLDEAELSERIKDVSILGVRSKTALTQKVLDHAEKLIAVGAFCIGINQIDLPACTRKGVVVFNAPYSNTRSVVELALGEIIMLFRHAFEKSQKTHQGIWGKSSTGDFEVRGKALGIVGYGNIGSQLSVLAEAMGMKVYYYDVTEKLSLGNAERCTSLEELLRKADVVTSHVDGRAGNRHLFGDREFRLMKPGALFLNLSRGHVADLAALKKHLVSGHLSGAAVDVFPCEPKSNKEPFACELQGVPNVILTPHVGGSTEEAQENIARFVPSHLINYVNSGDTTVSVNFPNIQLSAPHRAHRLIHIHANVPGVLAQMNGIMARHGINILGQYLKTNETIGYVITDVSKEYAAAVIKELRAISHTIKFRILY